MNFFITAEGDHREKWHMGPREKTIPRSCNLPAKAQEEGCHFGRGYLE